MNISQILGQLAKVRKSGNGWTARCPAHEDNRNSLSITEGSDGRILVKCFANCTFEGICAAKGWKPSDLFAQSNSNGNGSRKSSRRIVAEYDYRSESGELLYETVRYEPKDFRQRRPDGKGGWTWKLDGARRVLYRLPEVMTARDVLCCEGEKDCETAKALGFTSTTSGAAGSWNDEYWRHFVGSVSRIVADADKAGRTHAQQVACSLHRKAQSVKILELPNAKDLSEWVERGGTREVLMNLIQHAPEWTAQSVDTGAMLDDLFAFVRRFVSLSPSQARVVVLWIAHTHAIDSADATPYLAITSAEKQSGKTRLLEVGELLVAGAWLTGKVSAAVLIRKIDSEQPALLLDESDAAFAGEKEYAEALRGVLNTGHRRGGKASCCVGQGNTCKDFSTFCAKAIAGIGNLPDTVADRSLPIRLKRAKRGEDVERFRRRDVEAEAAGLRGRLEAWSALAVENLRAARPKLPDALTDRQQDGAEPLLAIADLAGGAWPGGARQSLEELCSEAQVGDQSRGVRLLADIRKIFKNRGLDRIPSAELAAALAEIETSPWGEWGKAGKPLTAAKLARLLARFVITPHSVRIDDKTPKGYELHDFRDAFERYLLSTDTFSSPVSPFQSATTQQANTGAGSSGFANRNSESLLRHEKREIHNKTGACGVVALSKPPVGAGEERLRSRKVWVGPPPRPVLCAICGQIQPSAVVLARHLDNCKSGTPGEQFISCHQT